MIDFNKQFSAKVLLFGEYTVLMGGDALAMPFDTLSAHWDKSEEVDESLLAFIDYIENLKSLDSFYDKTALDQLKKALNKGLVLKSSIPVGYGLGSSATVCAAVWSCIRKENSDSSLPSLKKVFSLLESFYHGTSSGVDPLVSYFEKAIKISGSGSSLIKKPTFDITSYLYDSLLPRAGKQYIHWFTDHIESNVPFRDKMEELTELNNQLIQGGSTDQISTLQSISEIQWQYLAPMIPEELRDFWKDSLSDDHSFCKLCGAGGGGMFLYFSTKEINGPLHGKYPVYRL